MAATGSRLREKLRTLFGIDPRSLELFRIGLGVSIWADALSRVADFQALHSTDGVLPLAPAIALHRGLETLFVLPYMTNWPAMPAVLTGLSCLIAGAVVVGWHTRLAWFASWFLQAAVQVRNPLVLSYGDQILNLCLFWGLFLPLGSRWSLDARRRGRRHDGDAPILSGASVALLLQFAFVYLFAALHKTHPDWWEGNAVFFALSFSFKVTEAGAWLLQFPGVMRILTWTTLAWEYGVALLLFAPVWTGPLRTIGVASFWAFHLGLSAAIVLGTFPWICMFASLVFLPRWFWNRIGVPAGTAGETPAPSFTRAVLTHVVPGVLIAAVTILNVQQVRDAEIDPWIERTTTALRLRQDWRMFAPGPNHRVGWYVMPGRLADGRLVDLNRDGAPLSFEKPDSQPWMARSLRWGDYLTKVRRYEGLPELVTLWACRDWNTRHEGDDRLLEASLVRIEVTNTLHGASRPRRIPMATYDCVPTSEPEAS